MATQVVNIRRRQTFEAYIGRVTSCPESFSGLGSDGIYGNPIIRGCVCPVCGVRHNTPAETLPCFRTYLRQRCAADPAFASAVEALRGKRLGCFCAPEECHGDAYVDLFAGNL